mmetsp:Transcript_30032/g.56143  ORF Transcript_30032/g.56143 Transcript_30032/m.56143 type:complete len:371 (-) Transcript_30032:244-1356(-)
MIATTIPGVAGCAVLIIALGRFLRRFHSPPPLVSIIIPAHNAMPWLDEALESVLAQEGIPKRALEVSIYNDLSTDGTTDAIAKWSRKLQAKGISVSVSGGPRRSPDETPGGDGAARNRAVRQSRGRYLCFLDADDVMMPDRIARQLKIAEKHPNAIVGSGFFRLPRGSTRHYTKWANALTSEDLYLQQYREITMIQPTWFFDRKVYDRVGGYPEEKGLNDMVFFHRHLDHKGAELIRDPKELVMYRYTSTSLSWKSSRREILRCRIRPFERRVLMHWDKFSIWGAGRDGHNFYKELSPELKERVVAFCDIDPKKIAHGFHSAGRVIPVVHYSKVKPPIVICVSMGRTNGALERNIDSLGLKQGDDYWHFS